MILPKKSKGRTVMATVIISDARTLKTEVNDIESKAMQRVMSLLPTVLAARISSALETERQRGRYNPEEIDRKSVV